MEFGPGFGGSQHDLVSGGFFEGLALRAVARSGHPSLMRVHETPWQGKFHAGKPVGCHPAVGVIRGRE
jgi:hypothetical protein